MNITIGKIIKREFDKSGMTKSAFADKIGVSRNNIYYLFEKDNIKTQLLEAIGDALQHNFFQYYSDTPEESNIVAEDDVIYRVKRKSKLSLLIEIDPDDDILSNEEFKKRLKELMDIVS